MREIGLDGNGGPLRRRERPKCGARIGKVSPALFGSSRERPAVGFMAGSRQAPGPLKVERELRGSAATMGATPRHHLGDEGIKGRKLAR